MNFDELLKTTSFKLAIGLVIVFLLRSSIPSSYLVLSKPALLAGHIWTLVTYGLLHASFGHILFNVLALVSFGVVIEQNLSTKRYLLLLVAGTILGGLLAIVVQPYAIVVGASAGICALFARYALSYPNSTILLLIFPVEAKKALTVLTVVSLFGCIVPFGGISHAAHLGGVAAGYLLTKRLW